jgi:hypothetical protein
MKPSTKRIHAAQILTDGVMGIPLLLELARKRWKVRASWATLQASQH